MINKDNCMLLGTLAKPYGTRGMLQVKLGKIRADEIKDRGLVFVEIDGLPVPFFVVEFIEKSTDSIVIRLDGVDEEVRAREFLGCAVYLMKEQVKRRGRESDLPPSVNGYRVIDVRLGFVGIAGEIIEMARNPLLTVMKDDREFLIPVHEDIVLKINDRAREIQVDTPEGLFDL
jgi:16S rRNA processing protein RimM